MRMYRRFGETSWDAQGSAGGVGIGAGAAQVAERARTPWRVAAGDSNIAQQARRPRISDELPTVNIDGVEFHAITETQCIDHILGALDAGRGGTVVTPNLDHLRRYSRDLTFGALVAEAELVVADGMPIIWASRLQRTPLPQRVAGSDLISTLSAAAAKRGKSIFLLGGEEGTADAAAKILVDRDPELKVVGTHCPPFGFETDEKMLAAMISALKECKPDIVFVALGSPKQEFLIHKIRKILPNAWWLGVGVSFSFLCGDVKRAPRWMQKCGLEWTHRFIQEPRRLFYRYFVVGVPFGMSLMCRSALAGLLRLLPGQPHRRKQTTEVLPPGSGSIEAAAEQLIAPEPAVNAPAKPRRQRLRTPDSEAPISAAAARSLHRLRAVILLGGSVRPVELTTRTGRSILDLPLDESGSILNYWLAQVDDLAQHAHLEKLPLRLMLNQHTGEVRSAATRYQGKYTIERDLSEYRGTGGLLRDLAEDYEDEDLVLVANAAQILLDPLAAVATALDRKQGAVSLIAHQDGTPSNVMLVRCDTLRLISDTGYVDMKEQALPSIASEFDVTVVHRRRPTGLPVRSLPGYISALRFHHRRRQGKPGQSDPLAEDLTPAFALIEEGANVDSSAHVHDSVVLKGAVVESGAALVRSLVCPGAVVKRDRSVVEHFVQKSVA